MPELLDEGLIQQTEEWVVSFPTLFLHSQLVGVLSLDADQIEVKIKKQ